MASAHPKATEKLIEDKANGPAVVSTLQDEIPGLIAVTPEGGKIVRAHGCAPRVEAGNVWLPHPSVFPWVRALIDELVAFPNGANDDQVDSLTQYLNRRPEQDVYVSILDD
jgi:predicted phage terminase large subunit-like protein